MKDVSIVLCGAAGQGVQTVEEILVNTLKLSGYHVFATKEYMSRIRGGENSTQLRIASHRVSAPVDRIDLLVPLTSSALEHLKRRINDSTVIIGEEENILAEFVVNKDLIITVPFTQIAKEVGNKLYSNVVAVGVFIEILKADKNVITKILSDRFSRKGDEVVQKNIEALKRGCEIGKKLSETGKVTIDVQKDPSVMEEILFNGNEAVAIGAIAGGCNFISAYPMSPSTGVLVSLSQQAKEFGIVVDQAEDEIAAMNKSIAAWYAGARALASTSGGGFALMTEAVSMAGMIETPIVVHLAQRPGPATGLPTRTAQEDLNHVLYCSHGEFPRIIFAPGSIKDAFYCTQSAFNLADKYQVPVFILTDQYFVDSYYCFPTLELESINVENQFVETSEDYRRYELTDNGISPRGIPGLGEGLVRVDTDEHDEWGFITEDVHEIRPKMVEKRYYKRLELLKKDILPPEFIGDEKYKILVVAWGSTYYTIREAIERLERGDIAFLHFKQLYPVHESTLEYLNKAEKVIFMENNAGAQFAKLIMLETGFNINSEYVHKFLKYNGMPYSVEEVVDYLKGI
ncbi:MAG: 2-oxoacid:acceptor oxidoreductase subunit alpha [Candidatus Hodarchaeales archaeon]|jgi:2-oxoglutarate ferredoxin oxidoreductase subunit alpha